MCAKIGGKMVDTNPVPKSFLYMLQIDTDMRHVCGYQSIVQWAVYKASENIMKQHLSFQMRKEDEGLQKQFIRVCLNYV